jgi:hypothetical protein
MTSVIPERGGFGESAEKREIELWIDLGKKDESP